MFLEMKEHCVWYTCRSGDIKNLYLFRKGQIASSWRRLSVRGSFGFEEDSNSGHGVGPWDEGFGVGPCPGTETHKETLPITKVSPLSEGGEKLGGMLRDFER